MDEQDLEALYKQEMAYKKSRGKASSFISTPATTSKAHVSKVSSTKYEGVFPIPRGNRELLFNTKEYNILRRDR